VPESVWNFSCRWARARVESQHRRVDGGPLDCYFAKALLQALLSATICRASAAVSSSSRTGTSVMSI
jgi:hypothetical protein